MADFVMWCHGTWDVTEVTGVEMGEAAGSPCAADVEHAGGCRACCRRRWGPTGPSCPPPHAPFVTKSHARANKRTAGRHRHVSSRALLIASHAAHAAPLRHPAPSSSYESWGLGWFNWGVQLGGQLRPS